MKSKYNISDSEREVMEMLWKQKEAIKQSELLTLFAKEGKEWKRQTLNTFLARLEEKELVVRESRMVKAAYTEEEYNCLQMKEAIGQMYGGKLSNFVLAFTKEHGISKEDEEELFRLLQERKERKE